MATGVTEFIQRADVRERIDRVYPNPGTDPESELQVPNNGYSHTLIGNAIELLCQLYAYRNFTEIVHPHSPDDSIGEQATQYRWTGDDAPQRTITVFDKWEWEVGTTFGAEDDNSGSAEFQMTREEWEKRHEDHPNADPVVTTVDEDLSQIVNQYVETGLKTDEVIRAALLNAGWRPDMGVSTNVNREKFENDLIDEMRSLFEVVKNQDWISGEEIMVTPELGNFRRILPAAADFIADGVLIDVKTTEKPVFTPAYWRQLLMYYVLADLQREIYEVEETVPVNDEPTLFEYHSYNGYPEKYPEIDAVGVYFSRHGELQTVQIDEVIQDTQEYRTFRAWILDKVARCTVAKLARTCHNPTTSGRNSHFN
jgi:hypothetical protein